VVDGAVAVGGGADLPLPGLVDEEGLVGAGAAGPGSQFLVQPPELPLKVEVEGEDGRAEALALLAFSAARNRFLKQTSCGQRLPARFISSWPFMGRGDRQKRSASAE
jgi:hypothetical protein